MRIAPLALLLALAASPLAAQERADTARSRWDVTLARGKTREIDFTTSEGTWMAVDISPDGQWIVFDLLGHIYRIPATGGKAEALTQNSGVALNYQPRYSPDGKTIAFISDRSGQENLWLMDADGSNPRPVFTSADYRAAAPAWTPDGEWIVVQREYVGPQRREGGDGIWMYHRTGGEGVKLVASGSASAPSVPGDGRYVYFQVSTGRDALHGDYGVQRLDRRTGQIIDITAGTGGTVAANRVSSGGAFAPEISPDGRWLAFGRQIGDGTIEFKGKRFGPRTALWLRDLETGAERLLLDPVNVAAESGSKTLGTLPRYHWSADGRTIVVHARGQIQRVDVATGVATTVPFEARVHRTISEMAYAPFRIEDGPLEARFIRWPTASPDGRRLAFQAVGRIWVMDLPSGAARRLTGTWAPGVQEFAPAWSPDGKWIAFTTWDDTARGQVWKIPAAGGRPVRLTTTAGEYVHPAWSPDGRELVVARGEGETAAGRTLAADSWWDIVRLPASGGAATAVARVALPAGSSPSVMARRPIVAPSWGPERRIFYREVEGEGQGRTRMVLVSVDADGRDRREHLAFPYADEVVVSPDGRWAAYEEGDNVYVVPVPWEGAGKEPVEVNHHRGALPVQALTLTGGLFPRWRDASTIEMGSGPLYIAYDMGTRTADTVRIRLTVPRPHPRGKIALTNARIVTLKGDEVIERGTVLVDGPRIACVGTCDTAGATVIDAAGKTIIPGFVDMHAHHYREHRGYRPLRDYEVAIYLAYGVTTNLDLSMWSENIFPTAELIEAGEMIGPRTFSTGDPLYRGDGPRQNDLSSYEVTERNVARLQSWGAVSIKQYMQPRRDQRQWVSDVARKRGLMVTAEGGDLLYDLSMIMDGQTGWEHPIGQVPLYSDATRFFGLAGAHYSPTLVVAGPGPWNIEYWFAASDVWKDPKQRRWMPWRMLDAHLRRRMLRPETDYSWPLLAQGVADVIANGGYGALGGHGEHHGMNVHWELWMEASASGPLGALKIASLGGAHMLGVDRDIGSIEVGKLADLQVLDANPLEDIHNSLKIRYVMKGGVLYEAETLNEVWPEMKPFGPYYWVNDDALQDNVKSVDVKAGVSVKE
ncbi:MAG: PD40 domain-containing protein [Gemmatimonadetes bacterium]|nr:PD40 domain-containing protein [Gemmatimonadota bacterium]